MEVRINEIELVNQIANGDYRLFNRFYSKHREQFFKSFTNECVKTETETGYVRPKFKRGDLYLDELYQDSNMRMIEKIRNGKLYVKDDCLYTINKANEHKAYSGGLYKYLFQIGIFVLREMERSESSTSVMDVEDLLQMYVNAEEGRVQSKQRKKMSLDDYIRLYSDKLDITTEDKKENDISTIDDLFDFIMEPFKEEDERIQLAREIVKKMKDQDPCKKIFRLTYFGDREKKMKGEDIARELGMLNADTVRAQRSKCLKKFKVAFNNEYNKKN